ncbi:B3 domain-containing protein REM14-like [Lycium ferocissimum]|uniref:B3 domain-containing protein REM14-like n=1 Tax=Lycium ferocissimum TaxID=112874 RepID=UPI002815E5B1|nr:B3 domain-containing protein REM14-like [Lycium ferocissimum]
MKIPPKKPHFFKPIMPGFKNGIKIPKGFLKYLRGYEHIEHSVLKIVGKKWPVKVNGGRLEEGWKKFAKDHDLQEYAEYLQEEGGGAARTNTSTYMSKSNATEKPKPNVMSSHKDFPDVEAAKDMPLGRPHFISTIKPSCFSKYLFHVPKLFARENGLSDRKCRITIRDEQRSWAFKLYDSAGSTFIGGGWRKFCAANLLKEGDPVMFEMFSKGEEPV